MAINATNYSKPSVNATGFSKPSTISTSYGIIDTSTRVLLLQNGQKLLLQNGVSRLRLGGGGQNKATNYSQPFA